MSQHGCYNDSCISYSKKSEGCVYWGCGSIKLVFSKVPVPRQDIEWSCICVQELSILPLSIFDFEIVPTVWYVLFLILLFT